MLRGRKFFEQCLESALSNLSAPAERQIDYLQALGVTPLADELALELDDVVGRLNEAVSEKVLSARTAEAVRSVDQALDRISGKANARLWNFEALTVEPEWEAIRQLALEALKKLRNDLRHEDGQI